MRFGKNREETEKSFNAFEEDIASIVGIRRQEEDISRYHTRSKEVLKHIGELLEGKTIASRNELTVNKNKEKKKQELKPSRGNKNGLEDVSNAEIRKSWLDKATCYVKEKYKELKEKIMGTQDKSKETKKEER